MKAGILLQKFLAKGGIQDADGKLETESKALDDLNTVLSFHYDRQFSHTAAYLQWVQPITINITITSLYWENV